MNPNDSDKSSEKFAIQVAVRDLSDVFNKLCQHLTDNGIESVSIPHDYYWHISSSDRYDMNKDPTSITIGQLYDDWDNLLKIGNGESEPFGYAFIWLAALLEALGNEIMW